MLKAFFARLFTRFVTPAVTRPIRRATVKVQPRFEALETREVPASFVWQNLTGDYQFGNPDNWSPDGILGLPNAGDHITFGDRPFVGMADSKGDCIGMHAPDEGAYALVELQHGYRGTVTVAEEFDTEVFNMFGGRIDQPVGYTDIRVIGDGSPIDDFVFVGGILNGLPTPAALLVSGVGTTALIAPLDEGTIKTGDTLVFVDGATGTCLPGTLEFTAGDGLEVNANCAVEIVVAEATAKFSEKNAGTDEKKNWIKTGGSITVTGPGTWIGKELPVVNDGGTFTLQGKATALLSGEITVSGTRYHGYSQFGKTSLTVLENGSKLELEYGDVVLKGGKLVTRPTATGPQSARIAAQVVNCATDIELGDLPGGGHVFSTLIIDNHYAWRGGVFRPSVGWTAADASGQQIADKIEIHYDPGTVSVGIEAYPAIGHTGAVLGPRPVVNAGTRDLTNVTWDIITGRFDVTAENVNIPFEIPAQATDWSNKVSDDKDTWELKHLTAQ